MGRRVPLQERFWAKVNKAGPIPAHRPELGSCWVWLCGRGRYGAIAVARGVGRGAHVVSFELATGQTVRPDQVVRHKCDNPRCVRPEHLEVGAVADNARDMVERGRSTRGRRRPGTGPNGERNSHAVLTEDLVAQLRAVRVATGASIYELAAQFGISKSQAYNIVSGAQWKGEDV